jgi:hypothetical protein
MDLPEFIFDAVYIPEWNNSEQELLDKLKDTTYYDRVLANTIVNVDIVIGRRLFPLITVSYLTNRIARFQLFQCQAEQLL